MKRICLLIVLLLALALAACGEKATPTPALPTSTPIPTPLPPTATLEPPPSPMTEDTTVPGGGVEVALNLVTVPDQEVIAVVGREEIPTVAYREELTRALYIVTNNYAVDWNEAENQSLLPRLQEQVLDQVIERALLRQVASQDGATVDAEEVEAKIIDLQARVQESGQFADWADFLAKNGLTEESIRFLITEELLMEALSERHGGPKVAEHVHASHILVETEEEGQEVLDKLEEGEDFADLAAEYSIDPGSKDQGGDLDWFPRGMMVSEFEEVAFSLEPGEISGLVQTDFGYHIIQVHEKEERELDPALYEQIQQQQFQAWFETQQAEIDVERLYTFWTPE